ncbi:MAG: YggT family protein [Spirochaetaceae bacterium]|nr:YggT family protein [Spirochaetaceae bacterium]
MNILAGAAGLYMLLIFIRVMLSWFSGAEYGRPLELLRSLTDPYLNWFRRFPVLRAGNLDFSPVIALAALSLGYNVFSMLGRFGTLRLGIIIAMVVSALWSGISFILGFFIAALALRFIACAASRNIYGTFWRMVDTVSQPVLYRLSRFLFRRRLVNYKASILASIALLAGALLIGSLLARAAIRVFERLPL